jgi:hypothetical protein
MVLTSPRAKRINGSGNFRSSPKKATFATISAAGAKRPFGRKQRGINSAGLAMA